MGGSIAAGVLVLAQAGLGGLTVEEGLHEYLVAAPPRAGDAVPRACCSRCGGSRSEPQPAEAERQPRPARRSRSLAAALILATIVAGGLVAGTEGEGTPTEPVLGAHTACGEQFPTCVDRFMPFGEDRLIDIQLTHRLFMYLAALAVLALVVVAIRQRAPSRSFRALGGLLVAQIALGAANVWLGKHAGLILAHLTLGTIVWATAVYAWTTLMPVPAPRPEAVRRAEPATVASRLMESTTAKAPEPRPARAAGTSARALLAHVRDYIALTKPRIISLLLVTTVATMVVAAPEGLALSTVLWTMLGGYLAAGGAGAINHYLDRERDARMARTRGRPLVAGRIEPLHGLVFGIVLGALAFVQLALTVNLLSAVARDGRPARLRLRLHDVAEAADAAEHRHRRRRRRGAAAGRLGRGDRRAHARRALPVRDRVPLDAAPLLGALAADQGRLRPHRRADAARRARRRGDPAPDRDLRRGARRVHPGSRSPPASSAASTSRRR